MMNEKQVLIDLVQYYGAMVHNIVDDLDLAAASWQPDPEANNISQTLWHMARSFDILKTRCLVDRPIEDEIWFSGGWLSRTGYDPRGIGWNPSGNLAGYTRAEVLSVPLLSSQELASYLDEAVQEMIDYLEGIDVETLHHTAPGIKEPSKSCYEWIWNFLIDGMMHLGEIKAIAAMYVRKEKAS